MRPLFPGRDYPDCGAHVILASDFWRSQDAVRSAADPSSTFTRAGTAWRAYYTGDDPHIESVANDVLRANWVKDANGAWIRGALLEPAETNRVKRSCRLATAPWAVNGAAVVTEATGETTDPAGGNLACKVAGLGAGGVDEVRQPVAGLGASAPLMVAGWVKRMSTSGTLQVHFASFGIFTMDLAACPSGWFRMHRDSPYVSVDTDWTSHANGSAYYQLDASAGAPLSVYFYGAYMSAGSGHYSAGSDIGPTAGAVESRTADSTWQVAGPYPDAGQGWLAFPFKIPSRTPPAEIPILTLSDGGAAADRIRLVINTSGNLEGQSAATGGDAGLSTGGAIADGLVHQIWLSWRDDYLRCAVDGVMSTPDSAVTIPDGLDRLELHPCGGVIGDIQMGDEFRAVPFKGRTIDRIAPGG